MLNRFKGEVVSKQYITRRALPIDARPRTIVLSAAQEKAFAKKAFIATTAVILIAWFLSGLLAF